MKNRLVSCLLSLVLLPALVSVHAAARPMDWQAREAFKAETKGNRNLPYAERVKVWRSLRERPEFATNALARLAIAEGIVDACAVKNMHEIRLWNVELYQEIPGEVRMILDDPRYTFRQKFPFARRLAVYHASEKSDFASAKKAVDDLVAAYPNLNKDDQTLVEEFMTDWYRWQDRFDEMWAALRRMSALNAYKASEKAVKISEGLDDYSHVHEFFASYNDLSEELLRGKTRWSSPARREELKKLAEPYVKDAKNPLDKRAPVVVEYFCNDSSAEERAIRASVKDANFAKLRIWGAGEKIARAYRYGDWQLVLDLFDLLEKVDNLGQFRSRVVRNRLRVMCLGALGRNAEGAALAAKWAAEKDVKPMDRAKFLTAAAILRHESVGPVVASIVAKENFKVAEASAVWCTASRQALLWGDSATAEFCTAEYEKLHKPMPKRSMKIAWFDKPIESVEDWRRENAKFDIQPCDIKFGFSMDELVTDVATGRSPVQPSAFDNDDTRMDVSAACDPKGFHLFLRVKDPNARAVEGRFASGMTAEMYFAPGEDTPYVCLGTAPAHGVEFMFQPMYESRAYRHVDLERRGKDGSFRIDWSYTDTDYVQHLFFSWENYYQRLPRNGTAWKFDVISWTPKGGFTWAGSQGIHSCLSWGDLVFSLTPAQETAIRRGLLYETRSKWRRLVTLDTPEWRTAGVLDVFEKWADLEIGDRKFYDEVLKSLEKELSDAMAEVKPGMSDADVNRVFDKFHTRCCGLRHEIDRLRRKWLLKEMTSK